MTKVLLTTTLEPLHANPADAARRLNVAEGAVDPDFGVVSIDPVANLYAVLVDEASAHAAAQLPGVEGPFSNPQIETFGPPRSRTDAENHR